MRIRSRVLFLLGGVTRQTMEEGKASDPLGRVLWGRVQQEVVSAAPCQSPGFQFPVVSSAAPQQSHGLVALTASFTPSIPNEDMHGAVYISSTPSSSMLGTGAHGAKPPQVEKIERGSPNLYGIAHITSSPLHLEAYLVERGYAFPSASLTGASNQGGEPELSPSTRRPTRQDMASDVCGYCSELQFNPEAPDCSGHIIAVIEQSSEDSQVCYCCTSCKKLVPQQQGMPPWTPHFAEPLSSFFSHADSVGQADMCLPKLGIVWIMRCMTWHVSAESTEELMSGSTHASLTAPAIRYWRRVLREAALKSLADRPRLGGSSENVQVAVFKLHRSYPDGESTFLILGLLAESTREFRPMLVKDVDPDSIAKIVATHVLPKTRIISSKNEAFSRLKVVEDGDGPMCLVHDTRPGRSAARPSSKKRKSSCRTQKIHSAWRWIVDTVELDEEWLGENSTEGAEELHGHLGWFWWSSLNGPKRCRDSLLRLFESVAEVYRN